MSSPAEFAVLQEKAGLSVKGIPILIVRSPRTVRSYESIDKSVVAAPPLVIDATNRAVSGQYDGSGQRATFRFEGLFTDIGGICIPSDKIGRRNVFTPECDRFARQTYPTNYSDGDDHGLAGDNWPFAQQPEHIPSLCLLLTGLPRQPFSIAGISDNNALGKPYDFLSETHGALFHDPMCRGIGR